MDQTFTAPSAPAVAALSVDLDITAARTWLWALKVATHSPLSTFQTLLVLSAEPVTTNLLQAENSADHTSLLCPSSLRRGRIVELSHIVAVQSSDAVTSCLPSCANATERSMSVCTQVLLKHFPVATSQNFSWPLLQLPLLDAVASTVPPGLNLAHLTSFPCGSNDFTQSPVSVNQTLAVLSHDAVTTGGWRDRTTCTVGSSTRPTDFKDSLSFSSTGPLSNRNAKVPPDASPAAPTASNSSLRAAILCCGLR
mmetsp:Transcript_6087/g.10473  ORF Transcript_6087/g.10473 Transcript_6087/m.10473 type:complete len:253 (-) Transcript_6087:78-836(-)